MRPLPFLDLSHLSSAKIEVSLIIPAKNSSRFLEATVIEAHHFLSQRFQTFEILIVPNSDIAGGQIADQLALKFPQVKVFRHSSPVGKGAAIRTGFLNSQGHWIFLTDADLPYDLAFFDEAIKKLKSGYDLITGNRRLPESQFNIPVKLLRLAYGRHRLGLRFNQLVRFLLPINTGDTQAGIKAMSRKLALEAFSRQTCPGFLFDLELFLTATALEYHQTELPVTLNLKSEKSTVRILKECILVAHWLTQIIWRNSKKKYGPTFSKKILSRYQNASFQTRTFLFARWILTPYSTMAAYVPTQGRILDLGCGHGLFTLALALRFPFRQIIGMDHDSNRIAIAQLATKEIKNISLQVGSLVDPIITQENFSGIMMIDILHYFDTKTQEKLILWAFKKLEPGGVLLVREVEPRIGMRSTWNQLYEKIATQIGFTQSEEKHLHFRSSSEWENLMKKVGFEVFSERCSSLFFADILYVCKRIPSQ